MNIRPLGVVYEGNARLVASCADQESAHGQGVLRKGQTEPIVAALVRGLYPNLSFSSCSIRGSHNVISPLFESSDILVCLRGRTDRRLFEALSKAIHYRRR